MRSMAGPDTGFKPNHIPPMAKITLIGAGSVVFAKNLISDILQFPELSASTIALMDNDPARLETARVMAERVVRKLGVKAKIEATMDRRKAITGANYVICTIQVGGYKPGTVIDFEIPRKFGLLQTIGDTLGVGGVFRGLRTIPKILEITRDIAEVGAPGCTFLNYTNPMAMLCMAADRAVGVPMVGLCHSVQGTSQQLANYAGLDYRHVTYRVAGINHMAFFLDYKYRGQDAYPLLFNLLDKPGFSQDKVRFEMMRRLGYFVTESSEHFAEYVPWFIKDGREDLIERFGIPLDEYPRRCEAQLAAWRPQREELEGGGSIGTGGSGAASGTSGATPSGESDSGCGCRTSSRGSSPLLGLLAALSLFFVRRSARRDRPHTA